MKVTRWFAGLLLLASLAGCVVTPVGYRYDDGYGYRGYDRHHGYDYRDRWGYRDDWRYHDRDNQH